MTLINPTEYGKSYFSYAEVCAKRARVERRMRVAGHVALLAFVLLGLIPFIIVLVAEYGRP